MECRLIDYHVPFESRAFIQWQNHQNQYGIWLFNQRFKETKRTKDKRWLKKAFENDWKKNSISKRERESERIGEKRRFQIAYNLNDSLYK